MKIQNTLNYSRIMIYGIVIVLIALLANLTIIFSQSKSSISLTGFVSDNIRVINETVNSQIEQEIYSESSYVIYYSITFFIAMLIIVILIIISLPKLKRYT